ncbi:Ivy family c-type lysozyme inhibitor [Dyella koreensis]|uniref:Inhibitor of vertebrate lysozyme (Ivy) n=1 Tax=Dyella koreensis TaxID=311235 RepID=A0ABW8K650_9GAMM
MKLSAIALAFSAALACAACSQDKNGAASAPAASATTNKIDVASSVSAAESLPVDADTAAKGPYLFDLLQRPDFSAAFAKLSGASDLPDWTRQGGTSAPAQHVVVSGKSMLVASGCKPHDCPGERIVLLYDEKTHDLWGVFAKRTGEAPVDVGDTRNDQLSWLGGPDEGVKVLLKRKLYSPE